MRSSGTPLGGSSASQLDREAARREAGPLEGDDEGVRVGVVRAVPGSPGHDELTVHEPSIGVHHHAVQAHVAPTAVDGAEPDHHLGGEVDVRSVGGEPGVGPEPRVLLVGRGDAGAVRRPRPAVAEQPPAVATVGLGALGGHVSLEQAVEAERIVAVGLQRLEHLYPEHAQPDLDHALGLRLDDRLADVEAAQHGLDPRTRSGPLGRRRPRQHGHHTDVGELLAELRLPGLDALAEPERDPAVALTVDPQALVAGLRGRPRLHRFGGLLVAHVDRLVAVRVVRCPWVLERLAPDEVVGGQRGLDRGRPGAGGGSVDERARSSGSPHPAVSATTIPVTASQRSMVPPTTGRTDRFRRRGT